MAMRQQQSDLLKSFTDVQQSMQSQMQKQAELQQRQMQQNNQIMMMMTQMMQSMKNIKKRLYIEMAFMLIRNFCCIILLHVVPSREATREIC